MSDTGGRTRPPGVELRILGEQCAHADPTHVTIAYGATLMAPLCVLNIGWRGSFAWVGDRSVHENSWGRQRPGRHRERRGSPASAQSPPRARPDLRLRPGLAHRAPGPRPA